MRLKGMLSALAGAALMAGCGGGDSDPEVYKVDSGIAQKGPLQRGSWVSVNELYPQTLQPTGSSFDFQILDDMGRFNPQATVFARRYVQSTALGYYFNEVTGKVSADLAILRGLNDLDTDRSLNMNVLTDLSFERIRRLVTQTSSPRSFASARNSAMSEVLRAFFIYNRADLMPGGAAGPANFSELDLGQVREVDLMLASVSALLVEAGGSSGGNISQLMNRLEADLTDDGSLNNSPGFSPSVRTQLNNASKSINWTTVATNLNGFYRTTAYTATNLRQWSDSSGGVDRVIDRFKFSATDVAVGAESRSPEYIAGSDDVDTCFSASVGTLYRNGVAVTGTVRSAKGDKFTLGLTWNQASTHEYGFVQWSTRPASGVCPSAVPTTGLRRVMKYTVNTAAQQIKYGQFAAQYAYSGEQPIIYAAYDNPDTGVSSTELTQPRESGNNVTPTCRGVTFTRNPDGTGYAMSQFICTLVNGKTMAINVTGHVYPEDTVYFTYQCSNLNECDVIGAKSNSASVTAVQVTFAVASGIVVNKIGPNGGGARSVALQSDGKIVVAGVSILENRDSDIALARYNQDGTLDPSFGISGVAKINASGRISSTDWARGIVIQNDRKIIVVGYTAKSRDGAYGLLIIRFNPNGTMDNSFGSGGILKFSDSTKNIFGHAIALQSDGKLVIAGSINCINRSTPDYCTLLLRYNVDGTPDSTFNSVGLLRADSSTQGAQGVVIQQDGKILIAGTKNTGNGDELSVARYRTDGLIDSYFGASGIVTVPIGMEVGSSNAGTNIALQSDGKILVSGVAHTNTANSHFSLTRLLPDGAVDFGFGRSGSVVTYVATPPESCYAHGIAVQPDGKIILAGETTVARTNTFPFPGFYSQTNVNFAMARYTTNGNLDPSFGAAGLVFTDLNGLDDRAYAVALQSNGSIILVGEAFIYEAGNSYGGFTSFGVTRYLPNGSLDASFGNPR